MKTSIEKRLNLLTTYAFCSTVALIAIVSYLFFNNLKNSLKDELTVKRINITDEHGHLRMVLSNSERQHPGRMNGKDLAKRSRPAGIIFFNNEGDECGGLNFEGETKNASTNSAMSFTMDQYHQDQVIQIANDEQYSNGTNKIKRGISINDYPVGSNLMENAARWATIEKIQDTTARRLAIEQYKLHYGSRNRLFIGRTRENSAGLFIADAYGRVKLKIYVDQKGQAKIEAINQKNQLKEISLQ